MGQLKDLARVRRSVTVQGKSLMVTGLSAEAITDMLVRFPDLRRLFSGVSVEGDALMTVLGKAVGPVIAAGLGSFGDAEEEAAAMALPLADQVRLARATLEITFPEGIGPFVEEMAGLMAAAGGGGASGSALGSS